MVFYVGVEVGRLQSDPKRFRREYKQRSCQNLFQTKWSYFLRFFSQLHINPQGLSTGRKIKDGIICQNTLRFVKILSMGVGGIALRAAAGFTH